MSASSVFESDVLEVADAIQANELYQSNGWTDGLPIVPPTESAVANFLAAAGLRSDEVIGVEPVRHRRISAEKVAIASVMALLNVLGGIPGQLDRSTLGHPGKFTFCVAEDEEDSIWRPLSEERGIAPGKSAVTMLQVESPH